MGMLKAFPDSPAGLGELIRWRFMAAQASSKIRCRGLRLESIKRCIWCIFGFSLDSESSSLLRYSPRAGRWLRSQHVRNRNLKEVGI